VRWINLLEKKQHCDLYVKLKKVVYFTNFTNKKLIERMTM
jgi:hypothetical protein